MIQGNLKKTLLSVCAIALLAGYASKDVEYSDTQTQSTSNTVQPDTTQSVDTKVGKIVGEEHIVTNVLSSELKSLTHQGVHNIESSIDGNSVILESIHFAFDKIQRTTVENIF